MLIKLIRITSACCFQRLNDVDRVFMGIDTVWWCAIVPDGEREGQLGPLLELSSFDTIHLFKSWATRE